MASKQQDVKDLVERKYEHGFVTQIDSDTLAPGLDEDVIRLISRKKGEPEFMLKLLNAYLGARRAFHCNHTLTMLIDGSPLLVACGGDGYHTGDHECRHKEP